MDRSVQPAASLYLWLWIGIQIPLLDARFRPSTSLRQSCAGLQWSAAQALSAGCRRLEGTTVADSCCSTFNSNKHLPRPATPLSLSLHTGHDRQCIEAVSKTRPQTRAHIMEQRRRKYVSKACQQCRQRRAKVCARIVGCVVYLPARLTQFCCLVRRPTADMLAMP